MTIFFLALGAAIISLVSAYHFWSKKIEAEIVEGAALEWTRLEDNAATMIEGHDRASFDNVYRKVHFPRFPKYALAIAAAFVLALPAVFGALSGALWVGERVGVVAEPADLAKYVPLSDGKTPAQSAYNEERALYLAKDFAGFYYYFGLFAAWLTIVAVFMRFYHQRAPGSLREELVRAKR